MRMAPRVPSTVGCGRTSSQMIPSRGKGSHRCRHQLELAPCCARPGNPQLYSVALASRRDGQRRQQHAVTSARQTRARQMQRLKRLNKGAAARCTQGRMHPAAQRLHGTSRRTWRPTCSGSLAKPPPPTTYTINPCFEGALAYIGARPSCTCPSVQGCGSARVRWWHHGGSGAPGRTHAPRALAAAGRNAGQRASRDGGPQRGQGFVCHDRVFEPAAPQARAGFRWCRLRPPRPRRAGKPSAQ